MNPIQLNECKKLYPMRSREQVQSDEFKKLYHERYLIQAAVADHLSAALSAAKEPVNDSAPRTLWQWMRQAGAVKRTEKRGSGHGCSTCPACGGYTFFNDPGNCVNPDCQWIPGDPVPAPHKELFNREVTREVPAGQTSWIEAAADCVIRTIERVLGIGRGAK